MNEYTVFLGIFRLFSLRTTQDLIYNFFFQFLIVRLNGEYVAAKVQKEMVADGRCLENENRIMKYLNEGTENLLDHYVAKWYHWMSAGTLNPKTGAGKIRVRALFQTYVSQTFKNFVSNEKLHKNNPQLPDIFKQLVIYLLLISSNERKIECVV